MVRIFVSWSGELSRTAAEGFSAWAARAFPVKYVKLFFSPKEVKPGDRWRDILKHQLSSSDIAVVFLTRESRNAPWVLFEAGAVGKEVGSRLYPILVDIGVGELPSPFEQYQSAALLEEPQFWALIWQIREDVQNVHKYGIPQSTLRKSFDDWFPAYRRDISRHVNKTFCDGEWSTIKEGLVVGQIARSPFELKELFRVANHRLDLVAQNHYYITVDKEPEHLRLLRDFLSKKKTHRVQIMAMNPANKAAVRAWTELMGTPHFPADLEKAVSTLRRWKDISLNEGWMGTLDIRLTGLIATSQNFYDGDRLGGGLVMVPMVNKPSNADRPAIVITRRLHRVAFDSYWTAYIERFRREPSL